MQEKLGMNDLPPDKPNEDIPKRNFKEKIHAFYNFFTVEPFLLCFILPNILTVLAIQQFNMEKACQADLNYTAEICTKAVSGDADDNTTIEALDRSQVMVADMTAWKSSLQSGLPAVATLFVGAWSDKTGNRKALMLIPLAGEIISAFGMLLTTYYFKEWPLWVTGLIEGLPPALAGGLSIALMGAYSYIADVTTEESRTFRVGVVAVIVTLGIPIATSISGIIIEAIGYYGVFGVNLGLYIFGFIFTYFRVHDVRRTDKSKESVMQQILQFFNPLNVWETLSLLILKRGKILAQIILILCVHTVTVGPAFGEGAVLYLYCLKKFSMDVVEYSFLSTYQIVVGLVGTAVAVTLFCKLLKLHDAIVGIIATVSRVLSYFVYAFAPTKPWFYSGTAFGFFGNTGVTAIRSLGTKIVNMDEVGRMCSLISLVEAIVPVVYTPLFSKVYSNTLDTFPGTFYVVAGAMTIPAFFIFIALYIFYKRAQRDIVKNPAEKEMYAHENDVTAL